MNAARRRTGGIMGGSAGRAARIIHYAYPGATLSVCKRVSQDDVNATQDTAKVTCADCREMMGEAAALLDLGAWCPRCGAGAAGGPEDCICPSTPIRSAPSVAEPQLPANLAERNASTTLKGFPLTGPWSIEYVFGDVPGDVLPFRIESPPRGGVAGHEAAALAIPRETSAPVVHVGPVRITAAVDAPRTIIVDTRRAVAQSIADAFAAGADDVTLDLHATGYVDSSGWGVLLRAAREAVSAGRTLVLVNASTALREVLQITRMDVPLLRECLTCGWTERSPVSCACAPLGTNARGAA